MSRVFVALSTIRAANKSAGLHFFDREAMVFFRSVVESRQAYKSNDGKRAFFVTSEQYRSLSGAMNPRKYTVRVADLGTGNVSTHGEFQAYTFRADALEAARAAANT